MEKLNMDDLTLEQELTLILNTIVHSAKSIKSARCLAKEGLKLIVKEQEQRRNALLYRK